MPVPATIIAIQLPATTQDSDRIDCACSKDKCISTSHVFGVQHIDRVFGFYEF